MVFCQVGEILAPWRSFSDHYLGVRFGNISPNKDRQIAVTLVCDFGFA